MEVLRSSQWHSMNWTTPWWENAFACLPMHMPSIWWCSARPALQPSSVLQFLGGFTHSVWSWAHETHADLDWGHTDLDNQDVPLFDSKIKFLGCLVCMLRIIVFAIVIVLHCSLHLLAVLGKLLEKCTQLSIINHLKVKSDLHYLTNYWTAVANYYQRGTVRAL